MIIYNGNKSNLLDTTMSVLFNEILHLNITFLAVEFQPIITFLNGQIAKFIFRRHFRYNTRNSLNNNIDNQTI